MKFNEKYPMLKDKVFLSKTLVETVFATMALENQKVNKEKVEMIVKKVLEDKNLKGAQFFPNQIR
jgi:hypothetical protein